MSRQWTTADLEEFSPIMLLKGGRLFDGQTGQFGPELDLVIQRGLISEVGHVDPPRSGEMTIYDVSGMFLVPGLWECHAHLGPLSRGTEDEQRAALHSFASQGILYVRDVGSPVDRIQHLAQLARGHETPGPTIYYAGPMLEKSPLTWEKHNVELPGFTVAVDSADEARKVVQYLAAQGVSHLKTFNHFEQEVYRVLIEQAHAFKLPVVHDPGGPLFHDIPMDFAIGLGVRCFEHAKSPWPIVLKDKLQTDYLELMRTPGPQKKRDFFFSLLDLGANSVSEPKLAELAQIMVDKHVFYCPTLDVFTLRDGDLHELNSEQRVAHNKVSELCVFFTNFLAARGVRTLVGQDGYEPQGTFQEIMKLHQAGLSPATIIRSATSNPATWFGLERRIGALKPGFEASLLALEKNPLESVEHLQSSRLIIHSGQVLKCSLPDHNPAHSSDNPG